MLFATTSTKKRCIARGEIVNCYLLRVSNRFENIKIESATRSRKLSRAADCQSQRGPPAESAELCMDSAMDMPRKSDVMAGWESKSDAQRLARILDNVDNKVGLSACPLQS